jgi:glycosyltransferase involved in cell wall biosynthesis
VVENLRMNENRSIRVGFVIFQVHLLGLQNYLRNLIAAVNTLPGKPVEPVLFMGKRQYDVSQEFPNVEVVKASLLDRKSVAWFCRKALILVTGRDVLLMALLKKHGVTVLSHSGHLGKQTAIRTIGWVADLQHMHLPEMFGAAEVARRDQQFGDLARGCDTVILSSRCGVNDLKAFEPYAAGKAELLQFVSGPSASTQALPLSELEKLYKFEGSYYLLPNQFWAHKNHRVVLEALRLLKERGCNTLVLATGSTKGHPDPKFFPSLMARSSEYGIENMFRVLGVIPFAHLIGLMRHATAIINPSHFEGWSTSVEEAKSMGKQVVLSSIPVHREQAPDRAYYFSPDAPEALADSMMEAIQKFDPEDDLRMQEAALLRYPLRQHAFAETYVRIVEKAVRSAND